MILNSRKIQFLSLLVLIYLASRFIPFSIGEPIEVFFAALFYYYIGWLSIGFYYALFSVDALVSWPAIVVLSENAKSAVIAALSIAHILPVFPNLLPTDKSEIIAHNLKVIQTQGLVSTLSTPAICMSFYVTGYIGVTIALASCFWIIRKTRIIFRLRGIK